jgi:hypothetical protein
VGGRVVGDGQGSPGLAGHDHERRRRQRDDGAVVIDHPRTGGGETVTMVPDVRCVSKLHAVGPRRAQELDLEVERRADGPGREHGRCRAGEDDVEEQREHPAVDHPGGLASQSAAHPRDRESASVLVGVGVARL